MATASFESWWETLGPVTKFTLVTSVGVTAAISFGLVNPSYIVADFNATIFKLQLWRIITASYCLGKFSFPWLMALAMLVTYVKYHEETEFKGRRADFVWMLSLIILFLTVCSWLLALPIVSFGFTMALCWIFCKRNPAAKMSLYFFEFNANVFPWALMAFHVVLGQSIVDDIVGIIAGHGFLFLKDMLPKTHGRDVIPTPQFLVNLLPHQRLVGGVGGVQVMAPQNRAPAQPAGARQHNWGQGRVLGT